MLYTDHQALLKCLKIEDATGRLARWHLALSEYDFDIFHVSFQERRLPSQTACQD